MDKLMQTLRSLDGKSYKALKQIQGTYRGNGFTLKIDYVQGDPFASPSRLRVLIPFSRLKTDESILETSHRKIAAEDFIARQVQKQIRKRKSEKMGTGKGGLVYIDAPGQEVLQRTAVKLSSTYIDIRFSAGLPANGRRIRGNDAARLAGEIIPRMAQNAVDELSPQDLSDHLELADDQQVIRRYLSDHDYVSFVSNGAVLPRESGVSSRPMKNAVPFQSPEAFEQTIPLTNGKSVTGMALPAGLTLIAGGGYHGKSTLLHAIERGIYNHVKGDGRELTITNDSAVKIRAEDGRGVHNVNITPFISDLPFKKNTESFSTPDASGSTSQAAAVMEALEAGSRLLLMDEDTTATNFMIRDARMQRLVENEPITPFVDHAAALTKDLGVSVILAVGGSGDYFEHADQVITMKEYHPYDRTDEAKQIAAELITGRRELAGSPLHIPEARHFDRSSFKQQWDHKQKVDAKGLHLILFGRNAIDLSSLEQLVDLSQTRAIARMISILVKNEKENGTVNDLTEKLYKKIEQDGLDVLSPFKDQHPGDLALPRREELTAALNRFRRSES
ncbi:ABC-ATPase domain-containing protein [Alteribacter natronophilus]|uniref:ABC-ATPase domain-containing protein n=1 Tax=Alteribacter natronophilus TaxID=2583810 RepID=UPI00110D8601|nr:ABC-ATPase domain-containing protein [Alteribacter natronophilus]TMW73500.1 ATPase [Alteribacter natronophilus]